MPELEWIGDVIGEQLDPGTITEQDQQGNFDITKPDMGMDIDKIQEEQFQDKNYEMSFYEDPNNVYDLYNQAVNYGIPDEWGVDEDQIRLAYQYFEDANGTQPYWLWEPLSKDDPGRELLQQFKPPPSEAIFDEYYKNRMQPIKDYIASEPDSQNVGQFGLTDDEQGKMELWKRMAMGVFGTTKGSGAATGGAAALAEGTLRSGLGGGLASGVGGALMGASIAGWAEKHPTAARYLQAFDIPSEFIERLAGTISLMGLASLGSIESGITGETSLPTQKGFNLGSAWKASTLAYDVGLFAGEKAWDFGSTEERILSPEERGYMALVEAYDRIMDPKPGDTPDRVIAEVKERMGFQGEMRDLVGHILADPLNLVGFMAAKGAAGAGKAMGASDDFVRIMSKSEGVTSGMKEFGKFVRGNMDSVETPRLTAVEKWASGLDSAGVLKGIDDPEARTWGIGPYQTKVPERLDKIAGAAVVGAPLAALGQGFGPAGIVIGGALGAAGGYKTGASYLFSLTPAARSTEMTTDLVMMMTDALGNDKNLTPEQAFNFVKSVSESPREVSKQFSMRMFNSRIAEFLPAALKNDMPIYKGLLDNYRKYDDVRLFFDDIAEARNMSSIDVLKEVADFKNMEMDGFIKQNISSFTGEADNITAKRIQNFIKQIGKGETALTDTKFKDLLNATIMERTAIWSGKYFNVKPDPLFLRIGQTVKSAQGLALLGFNPTYFFNNVINNVVTMAAQGAFGMRKMSTIDNLWKRIGFEPERLKEGIGMAGELGNLRNSDVAKVLKDMQTPNDALAKIDRFTKGANDKLGVFSNLSGKMETWSSAQAWTAGFKKAWAKTWKRGEGFDRMPAPLETMLGPDRASIVYQAIEDGLNKNEIQDKLWSGYTRKSVSNFVPEVASALGDLTESDVRLMLEETGLRDFFDQNLTGDLDNMGVHRVFQQALKEMDDFLETKFEEHINYTVNKVMQKTAAEGVSGLLKMGDDLWLKQMEIDLAHTDTLYNAFKTENWAIIDSALQQESQIYRRFQIEEKATWLGIMKGLGLTNEQSRLYGLELQKRIDTFKNFFDTKDRLYMEMNNEFGAGKFTLEERQTRIREVRLEITDLYKEMTDTEVSIRKNLDEMFINQILEQYPDNPELADAARVWRENLNKIREKMIKDQFEIREKVLDMSTIGEESSAEWFQHYQEKQRPNIQEMYKEHMRGAKELYEMGKQSDPNPFPETVEGISPELDQLRRDARTNNPYFTQWFGESKVVDADGKPLEVYHGTYAPEQFGVDDFSIGRPPELSEDFLPSGPSDAFLGIHFAVDPELANLFAQAEGSEMIGPRTENLATPLQDAGDRVFPAYLKIENPFYAGTADELTSYINTTDMSNNKFFKTQFLIPIR
jgi:hypothetical protein